MSLTEAGLFQGAFSTLPMICERGDREISILRAGKVSPGPFVACPLPNFERISPKERCANIDRANLGLSMERQEMKAVCPPSVPRGP